LERGNEPELKVSSEEQSPREKKRKIPSEETLQAGEEDARHEKEGEISDITEGKKKRSGGTSKCTSSVPGSSQTERKTLKLKAKLVRGDCRGKGKGPTGIHKAR